MKWSLSSAGRASALQAGGHRFEPYSDHHLYIRKLLRYCLIVKQSCKSKYFFNIYGLVVQLVRMPPCHGGGRRFEPVPGRHFFIFGFIAQLVEQRTENPCVTGSIPVEATNKKVPVNLEFFLFDDSLRLKSPCQIYKAKKSNGLFLSTRLFLFLKILQ